MIKEEETFAALIEQSRAMVTAAERSDWNELTRLSQLYFSLFSTLPKSLAQTPQEDLQKLKSTLQTLATNEDLIRTIVESWMNDAKTLLTALETPPPRT